MRLAASRDAHIRSPPLPPRGSRHNRSRALGFAPPRGQWDARWFPTRKVRDFAAVFRGFASFGAHRGGFCAFSHGKARAPVRTLEDDFIEAEEEDEPRPSRRARDDVEEQDDDDDEEEDDEGRFLLTISSLCLLARSIWLLESSLSMLLCAVRCSVSGVVLLDSLFQFPLYIIFYLNYLRLCSRARIAIMG